MDNEDYEDVYVIRGSTAILVSFYFGILAISWFYLGYVREFFLQYPDAHNLTDIVGFIMACPFVLKAALFGSLVLTITPIFWLILIGILRVVAHFIRK